MENVDKVNDPQLMDINGKLEVMHRDIKRLMERSNQEYLELMLTNIKKDFAQALRTYIKDDTASSLERGMVNPCEMRENCKSTFTEFLMNNMDLIHRDNVSNNTISNKKLELDQLCKGAPFDKCDTCFSEVKTLFNKQLSLVNTNPKNDHDESLKTDFSIINEEMMVKNVLEPLSNKQRLQILKSMSYETLTFTALSELTGLSWG